MKTSYNLQLKLQIYRTPTVSPKFIININDALLYDSKLTDSSDIIIVETNTKLGINKLSVILYDKNDNDMVIENGKIKHNIAVQILEISLDGVNLSDYGLLTNFGSFGFIGNNSEYQLEFLSPGFLFVRNANLLKLN